MKAVHDAVAHDKTKRTKFLEQMNHTTLVKNNIAKITSSALLISCDHDGLVKIEEVKLINCSEVFVLADFGAMPELQLVVFFAGT